jgi:CoA:oxalate CoA-transferase
MKKALSGLRVLDLSRVISGPLCGAMLADLGAEVIKIEGPGNAQDQMRLSDDVTMVNGIPLIFLALNRGKKAITLNFKTEQGRELFRELVKRSDVVIENFRPGVMDRLGLPYSSLKELNPGLVYLSISGFGRGSPYENLPAYDLIAQAMGGLMSLTGQPGGPPTRTGSYVGDLTAGIYGAFAICAALHAREIHGTGQFLEISLLDTIFSLLDIPLSIYLATGRIVERVGNADHSVYPFDLFQAKDGFFVLAAYDPITFQRLCEAIGRPDLALSDRFIDFAARSANRSELKEIIEAWSATKTVMEVLEILNEAGAPAGPVMNVGQIAESDHVKARQMLVNVDHPVCGQTRLPALPVKFSETPATIDMPAPLPGRDTKEILGKLLAIGENQIQRLQAGGVI